MTPPSRRAGRVTLSGLAFALVSAASFGLSGALARGLLDDGWTPGAVVLARIAIAAVVVAPFGLVALRGRWHLLRLHWRTVVVVRPVRRGGHAVLLLLRVAHMEVAPALLIEFTAPGRRRGVAVAAPRRAARAADPGRCRRGGARTGAGARPALRSRPEPAGRAVGAGRDGRLRDVLRDVRRRGQRPACRWPWPAGGMVVGALSLAVLGAGGAARDGGVHVARSSWPVPRSRGGCRSCCWASSPPPSPTSPASPASVAWARAWRRSWRWSRLVFGVLWAWLLLDELPRPCSCSGGVLILAGVVAVKLGERDTARAELSG